MTHQLLWDESFDSWAALRIASQPSAILFAADGTELRRWAGIFDEGEVLSLVADAEGPAADSEPAAVGDVDRFCRYVNRFDRAHRQIEEVWSGGEGRGPAIEDLTFAANGLAQFAPADALSPSIQVSEAANRLRSAVKLDASKALQEYTETQEVITASTGLVALFKATCDVDFRSAELPILD